MAAPADPAFRPIVIETNVPGRLRTINTVQDAARVLLYWPPEKRGDTWRTACEACRAALAGMGNANTARREFLKAAMVAGIFVGEGVPAFSSILFEQVIVQTDETKPRSPSRACATRPNTSLTAGPTRTAAEPMRSLASSAAARWREMSQPKPPGAPLSAPRRKPAFSSARATGGREGPVNGRLSGARKPGPGLVVVRVRRSSSRTMTHPEDLTRANIETRRRSSTRRSPLNASST